MYGNPIDEATTAPPTTALQIVRARGSTDGTTHEATHRTASGQGRQDVASRRVCGYWPPVTIGEMSMTNPIPKLLRATTTEKVVLPSYGIVEVRKCTLSFDRWDSPYRLKKLALARSG